MSHVHISNTPSSTIVIVELDGLLQACLRNPIGLQTAGTAILAGGSAALQVTLSMGGHWTVTAQVDQSSSEMQSLSWTH